MTNMTLREAASNLEAAAGEVRVVVAVGEGAEVTPDVEEALERLEAALPRGDDAEVEGFTVFRVNVDTEEATLVGPGPPTPRSKGQVNRFHKLK